MLYRQYFFKLIVNISRYHEFDHIKMIQNMCKRLGEIKSKSGNSNRVVCIYIIS